MTNVDSYAADAPLLYAVPDGARLLGIGKSLLWEMIRRGEVPTVRLGRRVLVSRATLDAIASGALADSDSNPLV